MKSCFHTRLKSQGRIRYQVLPYPSEAFLLKHKLIHVWSPEDPFETRMKQLQFAAKVSSGKSEAYISFTEDNRNLPLFCGLVPAVGQRFLRSFKKNPQEIGPGCNEAFA